MLTVLTVDLAKGLKPVDSIGVMTDARIVYASHEQPVPRDRALGRAAAARDADEAAAAERHHRHPPLRHLRPDRTRYRGSGQVSGYLLNQWSLSENAGILRVVSTDAPAWFGSSDSTRVVADDAAPRATARSTRSAASATSARATASTRSGSSARPRTSSRSSRSTRSTRSTSPTRRGRACSASSSCPATRPTCTRSATTCCSGSGRTSARTTSRPARSSRSSTSPTYATRRGSRTRRSARAGPQRSPTTTPSSSGRRRASSSSRSTSAPSATASTARTGSQLVGRITQPAGTNGRRDHPVGRRRRQRLHDLGRGRRLEQPRHARAAGLGRVPGARGTAGADAHPGARQALKLANLVRLRRIRFEQKSAAPNQIRMRLSSRS